MPHPTGDAGGMAGDLGNPVHFPQRRIRLAGGRDRAGLGAPSQGARAEVLPDSGCRFLDGDAASRCDSTVEPLPALSRGAPRPSGTLRHARAAPVCPHAVYQLRSQLVSRVADVGAKNGGDLLGDGYQPGPDRASWCLPECCFDFPGSKRPRSRWSWHCSLSSITCEVEHDPNDTNPARGIEQSTVCRSRYTCVQGG